MVTNPTFLVYSPSKFLWYTQWKSHCMHRWHYLFILQSFGARCVPYSFFYVSFRMYCQGELSWGLNIRYFFSSFLSLFGYKHYLRIVFVTDITIILCNYLYNLAFPLSVTTFQYVFFLDRCFSKNLIDLKFWVTALMLFWIDNRWW